jgi:hypothetical protein
MVKTWRRKRHHVQITTGIARLRGVLHATSLQRLRALKQVQKKLTDFFDENLPQRFYLERFLSIT